jgi:Na+-transporting NADH:ubiquinone oxidoreductase subunit NqrC
MRRFTHFGGFDGRICGVILASALVAFAPAAGARQASKDQQTAPPLGTVAKQVRAEKPAAAAGKKVWTNDNLPTNPFAISVVGPPQPPPDEKPAADEVKGDEKAGTAKETPKSQAEMESELKKEIEALALAEKEYDLSKRDFALQQQAFFANAMANQDEAGQAQLAEVQKQLDAMQAELEKKRAHVAELQAKVDAGQKKAALAVPEGSGVPSENI